jgi:hypothetical protein
MHTLQFQQLVTLLFTHQKANVLEHYYFDRYQKILASKNILTKIWEKLFHSQGPSSGLLHFTNLLNQLIHEYLQEPLSKKAIRNKLIEERLSKIPTGFSFKSLEEFKKIHYHYAEIIEKEGPDLHSDTLRALQLLTERLQELIRAFESALEPDLSIMPMEFIREYEELASQLIYPGSPWIGFQATALHQLVRRLKKEGDRIEFYQGLKASHALVITQCKQIRPIVQQLMLAIKQLHANNSDDLRFDLKELEEIRYLAKNMTYDPSGKTTYASLFNQYAQTALHEKYKKQLGSPVVGDALTFQQLRLALHIGKQHLEIVDKLCCSEHELAAKQQLIQAIIYGPNAAPIASSSPLYPFTCIEFRNLVYRSSSRKGFLQYHLEQTCPVQNVLDSISDETIHAIEKEFGKLLQASQYQKIQQLFDALDLPTREVRRKELIRSFSPELKLAIHGHLSQEKLDRKFQEDFPKLTLQLKYGDKKEVFNCAEWEETLFNMDGEALRKMLQKRYGGQLESQWQELYPTLFEKRRRQALSSEFIDQLRYEEMNLLWSRLNALAKYSDKKAGLPSKPEEIKRRIAYMKNTLNLFLEGYSEIHFGMQPNTEWQAITKEGMGRIGVQLHDQPAYYIDGDGQSLGYTRRVSFYQKGDGNRIPRTDLAGNIYRIGKTVQSLHINYERDAATYVLYHGLHVNDRAADLLDELYNLLRLPQKESQRLELSGTGRSTFDKS